MELFFDILKVTIPSFIVFLTAYLLIRAFIENDQLKRRMEIKRQNQKTITPLRLQAYERIILFLERISPESMLVRIPGENLSSRQLQVQLLQVVRSEFEHNLSQQIYISEQAWEVVKTSKESTIKLINSAADQLKDETPAIELSKIILYSLMEANKVAPSSIAIKVLKNEVQQFF